MRAKPFTDISFEQDDMAFKYSVLAVVHDDCSDHTPLAKSLEGSAANEIRCWIKEKSQSGELESIINRFFIDVSNDLRRRVRD